MESKVCAHFCKNCGSESFIFLIPLYIQNAKQSYFLKPLKELPTKKERGILEPWEKRVVAKVGFDVWGQGGEEIGVVVVVGFGRRGGEPVKQACLIYKEEQKVLFSPKKKKAQHLNVEHRFLEGEVKFDSNFIFELNN